jgi:hypothetical protein
MTETDPQKNIFFVHCDLDFFRENFVKKRNSEIIVFSDIEKKLTSREIAKTKPSLETIQFNISKRISAFLSSSKTEFLYYYLDSIKKETILKINKFEKREGLSVFLMLEDKKLFDRYKKSVSSAILIEEALR